MEDIGTGSINGTGNHNLHKSSSASSSSVTSSSASSVSSAWLSKISSHPQSFPSSAAIPASCTARRSRLSRQEGWQMTVPVRCPQGRVVPSYSDPGHGVAAPVSMDVIVSIYRELVRLINRLPFKQRLVVCIVFRGSKFRLDLGEVRAAGVACLIGLGLSLGTLLLYRLYFRIVVPFLNSVWRDRGKEFLDDEYTLYLESPDSEVDDKMGNKNSKKNTPSVYYAPGYGVALGSRPPSLDVDQNNDINLQEESIRLRPRKFEPRNKSPSPASDRDSAIGGVTGSEMSQSMYSDNSANRDSFYSTCTGESGFDDLMVYFEDHMGHKRDHGFTRENFNSIRERNMNTLYKAHHNQDQGLNSLGCSIKPGLETLSDVSSEHSGVFCSRSRHNSLTGESEASTPRITNVDPLFERYASEAKLSSSSQTSSAWSHRPKRSSLTADHTAEPKCPETRSPRLLSTQSSPYRRQLTPRRDRARSPLSDLQNISDFSKQDVSKMEQQDHYEPSFDASESIRSFNSSVGEIDWDNDPEDREHTSALPDFNQSRSDLQFQQSLMQRIQEWSTFAEEYNRSISPTPESSPVRFIRRSQSLDRHLGDPSAVLVSNNSSVTRSNPPVVAQTTEKNLETLEYELQDIQGEFESITSKLHELIEQGNEKVMPKSSESSPHPHRPVCHLTPGGSTRAHHNSQDPLNSPSLLRRMRTKWTSVPSSTCSGSSRSSRAGSVEYAWDLADYDSNAGNASAEHSRHEPPPSEHDQVFHAGHEVTNIGLPVAISEYVESEWKGKTDKARAICEGYSKIPPLLSCQRMSVVRGDNYCGLRSALFQVLVNGERVTRHWGGIIPLMDSLHSSYADATISLSSWTFANRLPSHCKDKLTSLSKCALSLYATVEEVCNLNSREEREKRTIGLFNSGSTFDVELMEGLKLLMLLKLCDLQKLIEIGEDVPVFGHLLFARDSSTTLAAFLKNHLNPVGDSGGLEQVEMCLLGYTLGIRIRVLRLSQCGQQDFDCVFPEDVPLDWPEVRLIAEDDRHYNVPLP